ncbi:MAG TPA: sortase [Actinomycetota bacterium]|nr:sortase [Actinomycetota bacterium]
MPKDRPRSRREEPVEDDRHRPISDFRRRLYRLPVLGALVYFVAPPRLKRPSLVRRGVSWTSGLAALLGVGMVAYPVAGTSYPFFYRVPVEKAIEWSNFLSDWQANKIQDRLDGRFAQAQAARKTLFAEGDPLTRIKIPSLKVDTLVVEGVSTSALKAGAGHYPQTPLPGKEGNVAIAGHRTTYGRPFNGVDRLKTGDDIILETPIGRYTYELTRPPWVTHPADFSVLDPSSESLLTLTTCHPKGSDRQRMIVRAKLVNTEKFEEPKPQVIRKTPSVRS